MITHVFFVGMLTSLFGHTEKFFSLIDESNRIKMQVNRKKKVSENVVLALLCKV